MVQRTPPSLSSDGMPLFSDPRFNEHLYHYQCRFLNDTVSRVDRIAPQVDRLQRDLRDMSAKLSFLTQWALGYNPGQNMSGICLD
jgi:hypothetical protein